MSELFECPRCGATSPNPDDIKEGYCGRCHDWTRGASPLPAPAMVDFFAGWEEGGDLRLPPPWWVPIEAPACGVVLEVSAEVMTDDIARRFVCDKPAGHDEKHRQVIDNVIGAALSWEDESQAEIEAERIRVTRIVIHGAPNRVDKAEETN